MRAQLRELPELFLERLRRILPSSRWDATVNTFAAPKPTTFRVNPFKATAEAVRDELAGYGFHVERVSWYPEAMIVRRGRLRELQETAFYRSGAIYVQSLSSMVPPLALDPRPGETVLDLTAAPGSKTTQMSCLMRGEGRLVANDNNRVRFFKLRANVLQQAARNVELSLRPGEAFGRVQPGAFDRVLADVPCSAEGRFDLREPKSFRFWKPAKIREMVRKQKRLLASGIAALRPGGVLVYSTCTFAPEENEAVIHWALERFGETMALEPIRVGCSNAASGLASWDGVPFHPSLKLACRLLPTADMEGFFVARLRKRDAQA
jgi:16S rRNA (cytosine1407-C5)-methyltransferase